MKKSRRLFLLFLGYYALAGFCLARPPAPQVCLQGDCVTVEVVSKMEDMARGLMFRSGLDKDKGMLFVFQSDGNPSFWMKNMRFNLDILWIDSDGRIVDIGRNVPACSADPCKIYTPRGASRYVLEVSSGYTAIHRWREGDKLSFEGLSSNGF